MAVKHKSDEVEGVVVLSERFAKHPTPASGKILYVEDNLANLKLMQGIIGLSDGLKLLSAHNAELGLEIARTQKPDMIILDINLPGMNGLEALHKLKEMKIVPEIPVIALSGAATKSDIKTGLDAGFQRYLTKPIDIKQVLEAINTLLSR